MPIFGSRSRFAVEYELSDLYGGVWMNGCCRYWCGSKEVGDYSIVTSLRDALFSFDEMRRDMGDRKSPRLWGMPPMDMFKLVDGGSFGSRDVAPIESARQEKWARHNIKPSVESFDRSKIYLVESESIGRITYSLRPYVEIIVVEVDAGEVDTVLESVRLSLTEVYGREVVKAAR
jgi:Immunity protein 42